MEGLFVGNVARVGNCQMHLLKFQQNLCVKHIPTRHKAAVFKRFFVAHIFVVQEKQTVSDRKNRIKTVENGNDEASITDV
jgi:hypothetical protein